ncbi:hypothetical protein PS691_04313 [Pseudomonas fluorescens]|uniref:Uncharacterized protein n=1 Tax=Pseudomonas fluorescens TaxID=294 RepID=A0A5E7E7L0_PSEFL|nr:hypothetical protein PS691_04313 [Pseudomonas fluorescens]
MRITLTIDAFVILMIAIAFIGELIDMFDDLHRLPDRWRGVKAEGSFAKTVIGHSLVIAQQGLDQRLCTANAALLYTVDRGMAVIVVVEGRQLRGQGGDVGTPLVPDQLRTVDTGGQWHPGFQGLVQRLAASSGNNGVSHCAIPFAVKVLTAYVSVPVSSAGKHAVDQGNL